MINENSKIVRIYTDADCDNPDKPYDMYIYFNTAISKYPKVLKIHSEGCRDRINIDTVEKILNFLEFHVYTSTKMEDMPKDIWFMCTLGEL